MYVARIIAIHSNARLNTAKVFSALSNSYQSQLLAKGKGTDILLSTKFTAISSAMHAMMSGTNTTRIHGARFQTAHVLAVHIARAPS